MAGSMSTKHVRTTGDILRFGCSLKVECTFCGNARTLDAKETILALGNWPLEGVSRRFRCRRCGYKQARARVLDPV
jgi:hypothetical protein